MQSSQHWGVVGGGFLGMTMAHRLAQAGERVTLYEAADHLGGLADAWSLGGVTWDRHYHVTLLSDLHTRDLLREVGLETELRWVETKTGFFTNGQLYSMSNTLEFLAFPPLDFISKLRLGATVFYASKQKDGKSLEQIPVADWLQKWSGRRAFERIWLPLLRAKLGENYKKTSAAFIWATIARMYAARRTGLKKEMFGYVPGGYARVLERMRRLLADDGVEVKCGCRVSQIGSDAGGGVRVEFADQFSETVDAAVLTCPGPLVARICPQLSEQERARLAAIEYQGIVCASLLLKCPLGPYYVTNITDGRVPFTAVIEMSALVDPQEFGGRRLVYLPKYVPPDDPAFLVSDDELREQFVSALERMYPHFRREDLLAFKVSRVRHVVALSTLGYSDSLPPMQTSVPGVFAVNSAHIVNGTLNVNETVKLANDAVRDVLLPAAWGIRDAGPAGRPRLPAAMGSRLTADRRRTSHSSTHQPVNSSASHCMSKPIASLSLDLDNKWSYMKTHGDPGWEAYPSYLDVCVPRVLKFLRQRELAITFFVVGQDAALEKNRRALASIPAAGHEVGNHSFHHEPWLHVYNDDDLRLELARAEEAIEEATGERPIGFRGPGFSLSPGVLDVLRERGYAYDCSTFPTFLGPLARLYYFFTSRLDEQQKRDRKQLFGRFRDGLKPLKPYCWSFQRRMAGSEAQRMALAHDDRAFPLVRPGHPVVSGDDLIEIPVTTMPLFKLPIHVSYLLYLASYSRPAAISYWHMALALCRMTGVAPSLLLHPLDFLGCDDERDLSFFPAMNVPAEQKLSLVSDLLDLITKHYDVRAMRDHAAALEREGLRRVPAGRTANPSGPLDIDFPSDGLKPRRAVPEEALS